MATKTKIRKLGPWRSVGDGWFMREDKDGYGEQAPTKDVLHEVLDRLVYTVALDCGHTELVRIFGKEIADMIKEARSVLDVLGDPK